MSAVREIALALEAKYEYYYMGMFRILIRILDVV